jgi:hypothetical protein
MPFKKGQSGNPKGRAPGVNSAARLRQAIEGHIPAIIEALALAAKTGDVQAARLLLDRALPTLKPADPVALFPVRPGLADTGRELLERIGAAQLPPEQGVKLLTALGTLARVVEVDELARRIEALESAAKGQEGGAPQELHK